MLALAISAPQIILILVSIAALVLVALIDVLRNDFKANDKLIWTVVILLAPILGAILYFLIGRKQKIEKS